MNKYSYILKSAVFTLVTICLYLSSFKATAQDIHFSQFYASPLSLNPALTGFMNSDFRLVDNYRNQWFTLSAPYVSNAISFDLPVYTKNKRFGAGIMAMTDASGDSKLSVSKLYGSFSYGFKFGKNNLNIGFQPGIVSKNFDLSGATFPDQYNKETGLFDPTLPTSGGGFSSQVTYFDLNAGIYWTYEFEKWQPELGLSAQHINEPNESFTNSGNKLKHRKTGFGGFSIQTNERFVINPMMYYIELNGASEFVAGSNFIIKQNNGNLIQSVFWGAYARTGINRNMDAAIVMGGIKFKDFKLGLSYDLNISGLSPVTQYQGAVELSIIYTKFNKFSDRITIPCERF